MSWFLGVKSTYERQKNQCMVVWIMHLSWGNGRGRELQQGLNWTMSPGDLSMMGWPPALFWELYGISIPKNTPNNLPGPIRLWGLYLWPSSSSPLHRCSLLQIRKQQRFLRSSSSNRSAGGWAWTASPSYWPLITSWLKFEMSSSTINFYCFTGSAHLR